MKLWGINGKHTEYNGASEILRMPLGAPVAHGIMNTPCMTCVGKSPSNVVAVLEVCALLHMETMVAIPRCAAWRDSVPSFCVRIFMELWTYRETCGGRVYAVGGVLYTGPLVSGTKSCDEAVLT